MKPEVKAIELKLAQGAKVRGGKLPKEKITAEIAKIRGVEMGHDVESPNRFTIFSDMDGLYDWVSHWQEITEKHIGIKIDDSYNESITDYDNYMYETCNINEIY